MRKSFAPSRKIGATFTSPLLPKQPISGVVAVPPSQINPSPQSEQSNSSLEIVESESVGSKHATASVAPKDFKRPRFSVPSIHAPTPQSSQPLAQPSSEGFRISESKVKDEDQEPAKYYQVIWYVAFLPYLY